METAISETHSLKLRVSQCLTTIRGMGLKHYMKSFVRKHKKYDNLDGVTRLTAVFQLRAVDENITRELEAFVENLKNS